MSLERGDLLGLVAAFTLGFGIFGKVGSLSVDFSLFAGRGLTGASACAGFTLVDGLFVASRRLGSLAGAVDFFVVMAFFGPGTSGKRPVSTMLGNQVPLLSPPLGR